MTEPYKAHKHESLAAISPIARDVHGKILAAFARAGTAPGGSWDEAALAELVEHDVIAVDRCGKIRAAYPFSPVPTAHRVTIAKGPVVHAMCAIDALGMSTMLGRPITIDSAEPETSRAVRVRVDHRQTLWQPDTAVVFVGTSGDNCRSSAERACGYINFFTTADAANAWADSHPGIEGRVLSQEEALARGIAEFGEFMRQD